MTIHCVRRADQNSAVICAKVIEPRYHGFELEVNKLSLLLIRTRLTETTTTLTFKKPTTFKVQTTKESSKQILERFFKSKNKGNDT